MISTTRKFASSILAVLVATALLPATAFATCPWPEDGTLVKIRTNVGDFDAELYPSEAPETVAKFLEFAEAGYYDDSIFHTSYPIDTALNVVEVDAGAFHFDGLDFSPVDFPQTFVADEACLANVRGALVSSAQQTFDGLFGIYTDDHPWGNIDDFFTVFGRIVDSSGVPIGPEDSLGQAVELIGASVPIDGHLTIDSPHRNGMRFLPFDIDRESTLDDQLELSDLARCFVDEGTGPTTTIAALNDAATSTNPQEPSLVLYDNPGGIDEGEMVLTTTQLDSSCGALLDEVRPIEEITEPLNFACPNPSGTNELWRYQRENRCSYGDFFWNPGTFFEWIGCFIFETDDQQNITRVQTGGQSCVGLAVAEAILDERRAEITTHVPDRIFQILSIPEPSHPLLALSSLLAIAHLRRRASNSHAELR